MELNLSSGNLINAGGAFLFLVAGIVILLVARQTRLGLRLGGFAVTFGLLYVLSNLIDGQGLVSAIGFFALGLAVAVCLVILVLEVLRQVSAAARRTVAALAAGAGLGAGIIAGAFGVAVLDDPAVWTEIGAGFLVLYPLQFLIEPLLVVLLLACGQAPLGGSLPQYKGRLMLGLAAGLFAVHIVMGAASAANQGAGGAERAAEGVEILFGVLAATTAWFVLRGAPPGAERFARLAFAAIVITGLAGCLLPVLPDRAEAIGPFGILRSIGAVLLVLAVLKHDVLGVPLPRLVVRRGFLTGGALAVLFIVAQVAQNFFSARYGLLLGGILAGAFVFAASPVQRAIERQGAPQKPVAPSRSARGYKAALRAAMRDGNLSHREERHLAEVATALGITPVQALDLQDEVAREGD